MIHNYHYGYKKILLRPLRESDLELLRILRNKNREYFNTSVEIAKEAQMIWYENYIQKSDDIMFAVAKLDDPNGFIGAVSIYNINSEERIAEFGRIIIDKQLAPEKGIGADATRAVCLFAFEELKLALLYATILKTNERIIKVDTKVGFFITGSIDELSYRIEMDRNTLRL